MASRSAEAAKEIKTLIQDSVGKVTEGTKLVDDSGKVLAEIVMRVKKVTDVMAEIASSSREQASGIEQVNKAITMMDDVTQQNAALVEQASAASKAMQQQATSLVQQINFFRVPGLANSAPAHQFVSAPKKTAARPKSVASHAARPSAAPSRPMARASGDNNVWQEF